MVTRPSTVKHLPSVMITYGLTLAAIIAASFFPEQRLWGFSWYGYFPWYWLVAMLTVGVATPLLAIWFYRNQAQADERQPRSCRRQALVASGVTILFGLAFFFFRARTHFLGDGWQLLQWLQTNTHLKPYVTGTFFVQRQLYTMFGGSGEATALLTLQLLAYGCGLAFLLAVASASRSLFSGFRERLLFLLGVASGGHMLLFFGYLESYPLFVLMVATYTLTGLVMAHGDQRRWLLLVPLIAAGMFHIFAVALIPSAMYLIFGRTPAGRKLGSYPLLNKIIGAGLVGLVAVILFWYYYTHSYFFRFNIVPLTNDRFAVEGYTMFSSKHLFDYLSMVFQYLPGLAVLLVAARWLPIRALLRKTEYRFLLILAISCLGLVFIVNPGLGMPRDWDLFSFAGVPLGIGLFYMVVEGQSRRAELAVVPVLAIALGFLVLVPRVGTQVSEDKAVELFDNYAALDVVRNRVGRTLVADHFERQGNSAEAHRRRTVNSKLSQYERTNRQAGPLIVQRRFEMAKLKLARVMKDAPSYAPAWTNLGVCYYEQRQLDSALIAWTIADALNPFNFEIYNNLGALHLALGDEPQAEEYWLEAIRLNRDNFNSCDHLLRLYTSQQRESEKVELLVTLAERIDAPVKYTGELADHYAGQGNSKAASRLYRQGLTRGLDTAHVRAMQRKYPQLDVFK